MYVCMFVTLAVVTLCGCTDDPGPNGMEMSRHDSDESDENLITTGSGKHVIKLDHKNIEHTTSMIQHLALFNNETEQLLDSQSETINQLIEKLEQQKDMNKETDRLLASLSEMIIQLSATVTQQYQHVHEETLQLLESQSETINQLANRVQPQEIVTNETAKSLKSLSETTNDLYEAVRQQGSYIKSLQQSHKFEEVECRVNGNWSDWGAWSHCSASCGNGVKERRRTCSEPAPAYGGANCIGNHTEMLDCNILNCPAEYVGCFVDTIHRAMGGGFVRYDRDTVNLCMDRCRNLGTTYAAVQDGTACFCSNKYAKYGEAPASECNSHCLGNPGRCGGPWRNSVWQIDEAPSEEEAETDLGCFKDSMDRAMPGGYMRLDGATVDKCIGRCREKGTRFAAVQDSSACFCANMYDKHGSAAESECNSPCPGNSDQTCGGPWRNNVWQIEAVTTEEETDEYVGCYKDAADRAMGGGFVRYDRDTVELCIDKCRRQGTSYAAVQDATACFCANKYDKYGRADDSECNSACPGNSGKCGGPWRNSVWQIDDVPAEDEIAEDLGCFKDSATRAMPGGFVGLDGATIDMCIGRCRQIGTRFAAVQDASACFCANEYANQGSAAESECNSPCPGNHTQKCGGPWRNSVWQIA